MGTEDLLVCPLCHGALDLKGIEGEIVRCSGCSHSYSWRNSFYDMTPVPAPDPDVQEMWTLWEKLQDNAVVAYDSDPVGNLSVGRRRDADLFADFSQLQGLALDIGCGPQVAPSYGLDFDGRLVGIDPLAGAQPREFDFVQGIGEYLPFGAGTFDRVLFATSLDHMLVPVRTLIEARRVVKSNGLVSIWFGHHDHSDGQRSQLHRQARLAMSMLRNGQIKGLARRAAAKVGGPSRQAAPEYMASLSVPSGAEDHFHAFHLTEELVEEWMATAGLRKVRSLEDHEAGSLLVAAPAES